MKNDNLANVGVWGIRRYEYLVKTRPAFIGVLRMKGDLNSYLQNANEEAEELLFQTVKLIAEREGITEELKAKDQMAWVWAMNNINSRAREIVMADVVCV